MSKIFQARLQQYVNRNSQMFKLDLEKAEEPQIKLPTSRWIIEKARESQKISNFCFIDYAKTFDCVDHNKLWKMREGNIRPPYLPHEKSVCRSGKQQLGPDLEQRTGSKLGKEYVKAVYCYPAYLTYMQNTSCKMLGWKKHKLESRLKGEVPII